MSGLAHWRLTHMGCLGGQIQAVLRPAARKASPRSAPQCGKSSFWAGKAYLALMKFLFSRGSRSVWIGAHQFLIHPFLVILAWKRLYGMPCWKTVVAIFLHDLGYIGCRDIDGPAGKLHPKWGADAAGRLFGEEYSRLNAGHSRSYAGSLGWSVSRLCWADKLAFAMEIPCFYLFRTWLSGELREYLRNFSQWLGRPIGAFAWQRHLRRIMLRDVARGLRTQSD